MSCEFYNEIGNKIKIKVQSTTGTLHCTHSNVQFDDVPAVDISIEGPHGTFDHTLTVLELLHLLHTIVEWGNTQQDRQDDLSIPVSPQPTNNNSP